MSVKISQLTASAALTSDDFFPVVDSGSMTTLRVSAQQILDYVTGSTLNSLTITVLTGSTVTGSNSLFTNITGSNLRILGNSVFSGSIFVSGSSIYGQVAELTSSTTNYTLVAQDSGKFLNVDSGSAVNVTVPSGLPTGFTVSVCQLGTGSISFITGSGVTINNRQGHTKTAGQYAVASIVGTAANIYVLVGDTAT